MALAEAKAALDRGEVPVGCVLVDTASSTVAAAAGNETNVTCNATRHCEFVAIDKVHAAAGGDAAAAAAVLARCELYVTVEPCIMCASALAIVNVKRVFFGCHNERFGGNGSALCIHKPDALGAPHRGYPSTGGLMKEEAIEIMRLFYSRGNPNAPDEKRQRPLQPGAVAVPVAPKRERENKEEGGSGGGKGSGCKRQRKKEEETSRDR